MNLQHIVALREVHPSLQTIPFRSKGAYAQREAQILNISTSSGSNWPITTEARRRLLNALRDVERGGSGTEIPVAAGVSVDGKTVNASATDGQGTWAISIRY